MGCEAVVHCGRAGSVTVLKPQPRTLDGCSVQTSYLSREKNSNGDLRSRSELFTSCVSSEDADLLESLECRQEAKADSSSNLADSGADPHTRKEGEAEHVGSVTDGNSVDTETKAKDSRKQIKTENNDRTALGTSQDRRELLDLQNQASSNGAPIREGGRGMYPSAEGEDEDGELRGTDGSPIEKTAACAEGKEAGVILVKSSEVSSRFEQDKKKGEVFLYVSFQLKKKNLSPYSQYFTC